MIDGVGRALDRLGRSLRDLMDTLSELAGGREQGLWCVGHDTAPLSRSR